MKPYIANSLARPSVWSSQLNCKVNAGAPWRGQVGHRGDGVRAASSQAEALPVRVGRAAHSCPWVLYVQANGAAPALTTTHALCKPGPGLSRRLWVRRTVRSSVPCTMCLPPSMRPRVGESSTRQQGGKRHVNVFVGRFWGARRGNTPQ